MFGIKNEKDVIKQKKLPELQRGYMQFTIPKSEYNDEELVWGWADQETKKKIEDNSFNGIVSVHLLNQPVNDFAGRLKWGDVVDIQCDLGKIPCLASEWIKTYLM